MRSKKMVQKWPNAIIPFEINQGFTRIDLIAIEHALTQIHQQTCIRFIPHTDETSYIVIGNEPTGCWSSIGYQGGRQELNLQSPLCFLQAGMILQQIRHLLGYFPHDHKVPNRDDEDYLTFTYQDIERKNIAAPTEQKEFASNPPIKYNYGIPYRSYNKYHLPRIYPSVFSSAKQPSSLLGLVSYKY